MRKRNFPSGSTAAAALFTAIVLVTLPGCTGESGEDKVSAESTCGGLSNAAAAALTDITGADRFYSSSQADVEDFSETVPKSAEEGNKDSLTFCRASYQKGEESSSPVVRFTLSDRSEVPPPAKEEVIGEKYFPVALQAVSDTKGADIYFNCRTSWAKNKDGSAVIHAELEYEISSKAGMSTLRRNMDILQHVARNVAGELGCENHGDIPERDEPW
ncbi:hypothetical protein V1L54_13600 [Streptomyces sp. TRM 70361]|uniref:hypothetical protein n=1 Tax=Streptomyces sp. TRM 70361 TaxID=3116553 RepID=UPI002E7C08F4|nr:hypothetical protein [Streptomyces sp. TRM 70361]MEE1940428.1 hypothetical protein [Streptomyces sp. TRM 70361]